MDVDLVGRRCACVAVFWEGVGGRLGGVSDAVQEIIGEIIARVAGAKTSRRKDKKTHEPHEKAA